MLAVAGVTAIEVNAAVDKTVSVADADFVPEVTVMTDVPGDTPVAIPVDMMVATAVLAELQLAELVRLTLLPSE